MPRYIVQTLEGEMEYGSLEQLRQAVETGLVSPDALVNEEGGFYGRPAKGVVQRPGSGVKNAMRAVPIPSPYPSLVLDALALLAVASLEAPRLMKRFPALSNAPVISVLLDRLPEAPDWPLPIGLPETVAVALLAVAFGRALFAAAGLNALVFAGLGAYFAWTGRLPFAVLGFAAAVAVIALGIRRLLARRSRAAATAPR